MDPARTPTQTSVPPELGEAPVASVRVFARADTASVHDTASYGAIGSDPSDSSPDGCRYVSGTLVAGRYRIVGLLGKGGMGEVCRADDLKLGQTVALKFLPRELENNESRLRRFLNEVRVARQISHPNVCRVYDIGDVDGQHYISMEYIDGEDLSSLLRRIGRLPGEKATQIARQLCAGVAAAHQKGILHRDLKPSNVMIDGRGQVRITDFGLAGLAEEFEGDEIRAGTPDYMSPEQLDRREVSLKSDIYSLGLVLYEIFTGKPAFQAATLAELIHLQTEATPTTPSTLVDGMDVAVERVILRCLEKNPDDRPASAVAVAAALPGGDPLAAALAAGEIPSPEMVAAAGPQGGLRPRVAFASLASLVLAIVLITLFYGKTTMFRQVPMTKSVEVLQEEARDIVRSFGYTEQPSDSVRFFKINQPALNYYANRDESASRWDFLSRPGQAALIFAYRESSKKLSPVGLGGNVSLNNPQTHPGDIQMTMGLDGRLLYFLATPEIVDHSNSVATPVDWSVFFDAAGLKMENFTPAQPTMQPRTHSDAEAAWEGVLQHRGDLPVRVEAKSLHGKPVFFETVTPYDPYWSEQREQENEPTIAALLNQYIALVVLLLISLGAIFLAARNWRLERVDRKGALRLAIFVLSLQLLNWVISGHHVMALNNEFDLFVNALAGALVVAFLTWVLYMALEPYCRRLWPESLVSWTRLLSGQVRDPLVGRDLLLGFTLGAGMIVLYNVVCMLPGWLGMPPTSPLVWGLQTIEGGRSALGQVIVVQLVSMAIPLAWYTLFLLLRIVLRIQKLAVAVFCTLVTIFVVLEMAGLSFGDVSPKHMTIYAVQGVIIAALLYTIISRFGVLSLVGFYLMANLLANFPFTFDYSSPYFGVALFGFALVLGYALFAFRTSLAGQTLFRDGLLQE